MLFLYHTLSYSHKNEEKSFVMGLHSVRSKTLLWFTVSFHTWSLRTNYVSELRFHYILISLGCWFSTGRRWELMGGNLTSPLTLSPRYSDKREGRAKSEEPQGRSTGAPIPHTLDFLTYKKSSPGMCSYSNSHSFPVPPPHPPQPLLSRHTPRGLCHKKTRSRPLSLMSLAARWVPCWVTYTRHWQHQNTQENSLARYRGRAKKDTVAVCVSASCLIQCILKYQSLLNVECRF